jgi:hypothetical protein
MKNALLLLIIFLMASCDKEYVNPEGAGNFVCDLSDPVKDLLWLKAKIEEGNQDEESDFCKMESVVIGSYKGQTVFIPLMNGALCCTCGNTVYNCEGEQVFSCDQEKEAKIRNKQVIWQRM